MSKDNDSALLTLLKEMTATCNDAVAGSEQARNKIFTILGGLMTEALRRSSIDLAWSTEEQQAHEEKEKAFELYVEAERKRISKMNQEIASLIEDQKEIKRTLGLIDSL